jgi:hypothetical protein
MTAFFIKDEASDQDGYLLLHKDYQIEAFAPESELSVDNIEETSNYGVQDTIYNVTIHNSLEQESGSAKITLRQHSE